MLTVFNVIFIYLLYITYTIYIYCAVVRDVFSITGTALTQLAYFATMQTHSVYFQG